MTDVCVIGDSLPAFAAALELAEVGLGVRLLLPVDADWPDAGQRDPDGALALLLNRVAAPLLAHGSDGGDVGPGVPDAMAVTEAPPRMLLRDARGGWSPVPEPSVFGIPAVPISSESLAFLRGGSAVRAYADRVKPLLTIGKTHELGRLVHLRMGDAVRDRLVDPLVRDRFGSDDVEVAVAAPGLNEALTLAGSLSGAVLAYSERYVARETRVAPAGGWAALRAALIERLRLYGVEIVALAPADEAADPGRGVAATGVEVSAGQGAWLVRETSAEVAAGLEYAAQAVVVDAAAELPDELAEAVAALQPERLRVRAVLPVDVDADGPLGGALDALDRFAAGSAEALHAVTATSGAEWTVRLSRDADGAPRATLSGHALDAGDAASAGVSRSEAEVLEVCAAAGLSALAKPAPETLAAPYRATADRDADRARSAGEREADPNLLAIGRSLHGDDLSGAVADAVLATIALRRRLTGIAD